AARAPAAARGVDTLLPPITHDPFAGGARALLHGFYSLLWIVAALGASPWWLLGCARGPAFRELVVARLAFGLGPAPSKSARPRVIVHGVSVGEVMGARALVARLEQEHPALEVVISTTTTTGTAVARRLFPQHRVVRFPFDFAFAVRRFLARLAPCCIVLVELEVWPNFLRAANRAGIPVAVVNGRKIGRAACREGVG